VEDRFHKSKIKSYGPTWETALRRLWEDAEISLKKAAHQLGTNTRTLKRHAARLGLSMTRGRMKPLEDNHNISSDTAEAPTRLERYRTAWLLVLKENPEASIQELRSKTEKTYRWLYRHDRKWLDARCHTEFCVKAHFGKAKKLDLDWL
jgi:Tn7-like transposition protein D